MNSSVLLFLNIGSSEMVLIVFVALLLFGGEKLPEIARGLGKGIRDFKDASDGVKREINNQINNYEKKEEDKQIEQAIIDAQKKSENQLPAHEDALVEDRNAVPHTMPVNDNLFVADEHAQSADHTGVHVEPVIDSHLNASHVDTLTSEPVKNT